jgi:iron complex outermembrane recepter protein
LGEITGFGSGREYKFIKAESITDLQFGYEFQSGFAKGLSLLLQINNATNAKYQEYADNPSNIVKTDIYGKTYLFGANYKF